MVSVVVIGSREVQEVHEASWVCHCCKVEGCVEIQAPKQYIVHLSKIFCSDSVEPAMSKRCNYRTGSQSLLP